MKHFLFAAAALVAISSPVFAETIAITSGRVVIGDGSAPIEGGTVIVRDGNIVAAGAGVAVPAGARQIDASGKWVTPGVFAGFTRLGLAEVDAVNGTNDKSGGRSGFSAAIDIAPAIDPFRSPFAVNRSAGVTRAVVAPEGNDTIFAGQGAIADSWLKLTIREGRNRQVRRMTAAVSFPTLRLVRWSVGDWTVEGIEQGKWREVAV